MIEIRSKREGFRRAGVAHSVKPTLYRDDAFTEGQLQQLQDEPMLVVSITMEENSPGTGNIDTSLDDKIADKSAAVGKNANVEAVAEKTESSSPAEQPQATDKKNKDSKK